MMIKALNDMLKTNTDKPLKVADAEQVCSGFALSTDYGAVEHFNKRVLPLLRKLGLFRSHNLTDYYGLTRDRLYKAFLRQRIERLTGDSFEDDDDAPGLSDRERFNALLEQMNASVTVRPVSQEGVKFLRYDDGTGLFALDMEAYRDEALTIYARTPDERRALDLLTKAAESLSDLKLDTFHLPSGSLQKLSLLNFFEIENGRVTVKRTIWPGAWGELVNRVK